MTSFLMKMANKEVIKMQIGIYNQSKQEKYNISTIIGEVSQNCSFDVSIIQYKNIENLIYDIRDGIFFDLIFIEINGDEFKNTDTLRKIGYIGNFVLFTKNSVINISSQIIDASGIVVKPYCKKFILKLLNSINDKTHKFYQTQYRGTINRIYYDEINYIESINNKCRIHAESGKVFTEYKKLNDIESELNDKRFLRCHQSFLVNMDLVRSVSDKFEMQNGKIVAITQRNMKKIKTTFKNYIKNKVFYNR